MTDEEKIEMIEAMCSRGGGFVQCLGACFRTADGDNFNRLLEAFPEYVEHYRAIGAQHKTVKAGSPEAKALSDEFGFEFED